MAQQETGTLYLRGVPRQLVREAKAEAARRGMSLTAFAKEALAKALGTSRVDEDEAGIRSIRPDLDWFEANRKRLVKRYRDEYVAIINRKVVDHDPDFGALANRVFAKYGNNPIAIPKVTLEERVVHIRSPRLVQP
ncbi:MAG: DUF5678 domain-containing protein [bacterium]